MSTQPAAAPRPAPLGFVLAVTFLLSFGSGSLTHGLHFIASASGFDRTELFALGLIFGVCYIGSALLTGPVVRFLENNRRTTVAPRTLLIAITIGAGLLSCVPPTLEVLGRPSGWAIWLVACGYGCITGLMWPLVEWYLSGGRRGKALRSAAGRFNITWTTAVVAAFLLLAPALEKHPIEVLWAVAGMHFVAGALMLAFPARPAKHLVDHAEHHEIDPEVSRRLLRVARTLLPVSYMLGGVLGPYFPVALTHLEIDLRWQPIVAAIWLTARIPTMLVFERWHGWHGKGWPLTLGGAMVGVGFLGCVVAPAMPAGPAGLAMMVLSLALYGAGMGTVYTAAIYYAMEVGQGEVDSGAVHETLIGVGYAVGPAVGLAVSVAVAGGWLAERDFTGTLIGLTLAACAGLAWGILALTRPKRGA